MCQRKGKITRWCEPHRRRYYQYEHRGWRPVVKRLRITAHSVFNHIRPLTPADEPEAKPETVKAHVIQAEVELRMSGGRPTRKSWQTVFCLLEKLTVYGAGLPHEARRLVELEIERIGWGWSRDVDVTVAVRAT